MVKAKRRTKPTSSKKSVRKTVGKKIARKSGSIPAAIEKEFKKSIAALEITARKELATLSKEVKDLKAKWSKAVASKKGPLKNKIQQAAKSIETASINAGKFLELKKHFKQFEKEWAKQKKKLLLEIKAKTKIDLKEKAKPKPKIKAKAKKAVAKQKRIPMAQNWSETPAPNQDRLFGESPHQNQNRSGAENLSFGSENSHKEEKANQNNPFRSQQRY